jgi:hypothetical protein
MTLEQQILDRLEKAKADIVSNIQAKGITASGRTEKAIKVKQDGFSIKLYKEAGNNAPMQTTEIGREAGRVPRGFTEIILQWMKDKGRATGDDKKDKSKAGAIAYGKIKKEGTDRSKTPDNTVYSPIVERAAKDIKSIIVDSIVKSINTRK